MLKLNQVSYLFSEWAPEFQPKVRLVERVSELHESVEVGRLYDAMDEYDDYNVFTIDGEYDDITLIIIKP